MSTPVRRASFDSLQLPAHILTLDYIAVPLSGQVRKEVRGRYKILRKKGPNDGLIRLSDGLLPGGLVVTDIGLDHYYKDPIIDIKTVALAQILLEELERQ